MTENEELLELVKQTLFHAREVRAELEKDLADIENPKIKTNLSKKKTIRRLRLIESLIDAGEIAQANLVRKIAKSNNKLIKKKPR